MQIENPLDSGSIIILLVLLFVLGVFGAIVLVGTRSGGFAPATPAR